MPAPNKGSLGTSLSGTQNKTHFSIVDFALLRSPLRLARRDEMCFILRMKGIGRLWDGWRRMCVAGAVRRGDLYLRILRITGRVSAGRGVVLRGVPLIDIRAGAKLQIGRHTILNSLNLGYHLNMPAPVKLMADNRGGKIVIGEDCRIHGACIHAQESITIGDRCLIAAGCQIMDNSGHDLSAASPELRIGTKGTTKPVIIEDDVWLATGVIVLPGAHIGRGSVISANSVVRGTIPPMSMAAGVPCRVIKSDHIADI